MPSGDSLAWLDQADARVTECVRTYCVYIQYVGGGRCAAPGCACADDGQPPFAYTVDCSGSTTRSCSPSVCRSRRRPECSTTSLAGSRTVTT